MQDRGVQVLGRHGVALGRSASFVRLAIDGSATNTAASHDGGETLGPVLTAGRSLREDDGRAAKLTHGDDHGVLQHAALLEVGEQRGKPLVQTRQAVVHAVGAIAEGVAHAHVAAVHVPTGGGRSTTGLARRRAHPTIHGHEAHTGLHHPPREQEVLPQRMHAVALAHGARLAAQVERFPSFRPGHRVVSQFTQLMPVLGLRLVREAVGFQSIEQLAPFLHPGGVARLVNLRQLEFRHRRMIVGGADEHRGVARAEVAAGADVRRTEDRRAHALDEPRVGEQVALVGEVFGHHGADVGQVVGDAFPDALDHLAAQQVVHRVEVVVDRTGVRHRADEAELVGDLGEFGVQLAQLHARHFGPDGFVRPANLRRCVRLQVPSVNVARTAAQEHKDAALLRGHGLARGVELVFSDHQAGNSKVEQADAAGFERRAAGSFRQVHKQCMAELN